MSGANILVVELDPGRLVQLQRQDPLLRKVPAALLDSSSAGGIQMEVEASRLWSLDCHLPLNDEKFVHRSLGGDSAKADFAHGDNGPETTKRIDAKRDLVIWLAPNTFFSLHHEKFAQKAFAIPQKIQRIFFGITCMDFQILSGVYVRPLLVYANQIVHPERTRDVTLLVRVRRSVTKMVSVLKLVDYETHLVVLDLCPLEYRRV
ncbi:hypothetical protein CLF_111430 [Clonorchis sinensis]|uniref:Uncharacterized protein n=1 Tax=Clonorchis sinensis TaxID=79923 RepID=G7YLN5_CLOSI|nr:hypothetical protein CLF_111430 [Clonorchis sinensis]